MANNHEQFIAFNDTITSSKRETLKKNRDAIREKIRNYFKNNWSERIQPKFHWQGSYAMFTILNPIKDESGLGAYDLDDGVYFVGKSLDERETVDWYHNEVLAAVKDHTTQGAEDTKPCVRVNYADGHHVDLPIYFMVDGDEHPTLAHKADPWMDSDPRDFLKWFNGRSEHPQLRRIVKYLKAWAEKVNQHLNAFHSMLKEFITPFHGVATKYLNGYLAWNNFVNYAREGFNEKLTILKEWLVKCNHFYPQRTFESMPLIPIPCE